MNYKLLALDMDGTLLNSAKELTPPTVDAIERLLARGVHVVIASGRNIPEMSPYFGSLKNIRYSILMSGGLVFDFALDRPVVVHPIPFGSALELIDAGLDERAMIHIHTIRGSLAKQDDIDRMSDFHMGIYQSMFERVCTTIDDPKQYALDHSDEIVKVNLYHRSVESRQRNVERLAHLELEQVFAEETNLECSPRGVSKASGLIELCRELDIPLAQTVAIGDAPNDLEILQTAGLGIAMGNASDEIKSIADDVTLDNDHDGIRAAIEKYF